MGKEYPTNEKEHKYVIDISKTQRKIDPQEVARALGAQEMCQTKTPKTVTEKLGRQGLLEEIIKEKI